MAKRQTSSLNSTALCEASAEMREDSGMREDSLATGPTVLKELRSSAATRGSSANPKWLKHSELQPALAATESVYQARAASIAAASTSELELLVRRCLQRELSYIANPQFETADAAAVVFAEPLQLESPADGARARAARSAADLPVYLGRMCEAALLKPHQEIALFQRMNFLLSQVAAQRTMLKTGRASKARLRLTERLTLLAEWHRDRIVEANVRLVISIVKKFVNVNNSFDELLSEGIVGLIRAVEKFDYDRGFRFSTYATQVVRRNSYRTVVTNQQDRQKVVSGLQDMDIDVSDEGRVSAIGEKRWHELRARLSAMLDDLDRREKLIIRARFSLGSHRRVHTLQSLADRLGISKERVRQLERRAMEKLRTMAGDVPLPGVDVS